MSRRAVARKTSVIACLQELTSLNCGAAKVSGMNRLLLVVCTIMGVMLGQERPQTRASVPLKEYSYASDGFAAKFPYSPEPHLDAVHPDFKVWTIQLGQRAGISIRLKVDPQPCNVALGKLKSMAKAQNVPLRKLSVSGRPAWEETHRFSADSMGFERYVCGFGRYYILTLVWPANEARPELGTEIMNSFRLINGEK